MKKIYVIGPCTEDEYDQIRDVVRAIVPLCYKYSIILKYMELYYGPEVDDEIITEIRQACCEYIDGADLVVVTPKKDGSFDLETCNYLGYALLKGINVLILKNVVQSDIQFAVGERFGLNFVDDTVVKNALKTEKI